MERPTPEQERDFYIEALKIAAPIVAAMDDDEQSKLVPHREPEKDNSALSTFWEHGTLRFHALTAMDDLVWEHIMRFQSSAEMKFHEHMAEATRQERQP